MVIHVRSQVGRSREHEDACRIRNEFSEAKCCLGTQESHILSRGCVVHAWDSSVHE